MTENRNHKLQRIKILSDLLDSKFQGPFGFKFGLDALLGLMPIFGDFVTTILSFYIIIEAALLGCSLPVLIRMVLNVLLENVIDFIPFLGNIFDFIWKANNKNVALLMEYQASPHKVHRQSGFVIAALVAMMTGSLALVIYGGVKILMYLYGIIFS